MLIKYALLLFIAPSSLVFATTIEGMHYNWCDNPTLQFQNNSLSMDVVNTRKQKLQISVPRSHLAPQTQPLYDKLAKDFHQDPGFKPWKLSVFAAAISLFPKSAIIISAIDSWGESTLNERETHTLYQDCFWATQNALTRRTIKPWIAYPLSVSCSFPKTDSMRINVEQKDMSLEINITAKDIKDGDGTQLLRSLKKNQAPQLKSWHFDVCASALQDWGIPVYYDVQFDSQVLLGGQSVEKKIQITDDAWALFVSQLHTSKQALAPLAKLTRQRSRSSRPTRTF